MSRGVLPPYLLDPSLVSLPVAESTLKLTSTSSKRSAAYTNFPARSSTTSDAWGSLPLYPSGIRLTVCSVVRVPAFSSQPSAATSDDSSSTQYAHLPLG